MDLLKDIRESLFKRIRYFKNYYNDYTEEYDLSYMYYVSLDIYIIRTKKSC